LHSITLPNLRVQERGSAKFSNKKKNLIVTLPVVVDALVEASKEAGRAKEVDIAKEVQQARQKAYEEEQQAQELVETAERERRAKEQQEREANEREAARVVTEKREIEKRERQATLDKQVREAREKLEQEQRAKAEEEAAVAPEEEDVKDEESDDEDSDESEDEAKKKKHKKGGKKKKKKRNKSTNSGSERKMSMPASPVKEVKHVHFDSEVHNDDDTVAPVHFEEEVVAVVDAAPAVAPAPKAKKPALVKGGMKQKHLAGGVLRPGLTFTQSSTTITVTIKVANVPKRNVEATFTESSIHIEFLATMPKTQAYLLDIRTWAAVDTAHCACAVNTRNIVLELGKAVEGEWLDLDFSGPSPGPSPAPSPYLGSAGQGMDIPDLADIVHDLEVEEEVRFEEDEDDAPTTQTPGPAKEVEDDGEVDDLGDDLPPLPFLESWTSNAPASASGPSSGGHASTLSNQLLFELD
jgi:hypothetical protein